MILYVVTDTREQFRKSGGWFATHNTLEDIAGDACVVLHYKQVSPAVLAQIQPWAICHSGGSTDYKDYDVLQDAQYRSVIRDYDAAQIGFCGGCQIIATFFGSRLGPMRKLRPGEPDPSYYHPGQFKEWGVWPVRICKADPLFGGLSKVIRVQEYHYWEIKRLGRALQLLASTSNCRVQAFRHRTRPIYGTQFHPEAFAESYRDGEKILQNFFAIARQHRAAAGGPAKPA